MVQQTLKYNYENLITALQVVENKVPTIATELGAGDITKKIKDGYRTDRLCTYILFYRV
jgi:hypothetical protein